MATIDLRGAIIGATANAIKAPCVAATTGTTIVLSGVQTIDGVTVGNNNERVLVKDQTLATQNGIYQAGTGAWILTNDFAFSPPSVAFGTLVLVSGGSINQGVLFEQTCTDAPIVVGTSLIGFVPLANATGQAATSVTSNTIGTGAKTFATQAGKAFAANQWVVIYETSNTANAMLAQITSYIAGSLVVNAVAIGGAGTHTDWSIVLTNSAAAAGITPPVGSGNVTGPGGSTAGHVATFADTTGKVLQDGGVLVPGANTLVPSMLAQSAVALGFNMLNGQLIASVSGNALTLSVMTLAGATPSVSDSVWFAFRSATKGNGALSMIEVTAALSVTVPANVGGDIYSLGFANAAPGRIWVTAVNDAGTVSLAVINCLSGTSIFPLAGQGIANVTAFGAGASSPQVFYGMGSHSAVPYSVIGFGTYEAGSTLSTAGLYATAPSWMETYRPGVKLPGDEVGRVRAPTPGMQSSAGTFAGGNAVPTLAESAGQYMTVAITPSSSANLLEIDTNMNFSNTAGATFVTALFQDSTSPALATIQQVSDGANTGMLARILHVLQAGTLLSTTFKIKAASTSAGTTVFNGAPGATAYAGGTMNSFMQVREIVA